MHAARTNKVLRYREDNLQTKSRIPLICIGEKTSSNGGTALKHLEREGFAVRMLSMGADVITQVLRLQPSLIILETPLSRDPHSSYVAAFGKSTFSPAFR